MVLLRVEAQLSGNEVDALLVHIVVECQASVLTDDTAHIVTVGAYGTTHRLNRGIGIAPLLPFIHHLTDARPVIILIFRLTVSLIIQ